MFNLLIGDNLEWLEVDSGAGLAVHSVLVDDLVFLFEIECLLRTFGEMQHLRTVADVELRVVVRVDAAGVGVLHKSIDYALLPLLHFYQELLRALLGREHLALVGAVHEIRASLLVGV